MDCTPVLTGIALTHRFTLLPGDVVDEYAVVRRHHGLVYAISGTAEYTMKDGTMLSLSAGEAMYLPAGIAYTLCPGTAEAFVHMTVNFDLLDPGPLFPAPVKRRLTSPAKLEQIFSSLVHCWTVRHTNYRIRAMGLTYELLYCFLAEIAAAPKQYMELVRPARDYLDAHFCEDFSLNILPDLCSLSPTYFRRQFARVFGESAEEYRRRLRIAKACDLLQAGSGSIAAVALACGYTDPAYFCRVFHAVMGKSPSEYRRYGVQADRY